MNGCSDRAFSLKRLSDDTWLVLVSSLNPVIPLNSVMAQADVVDTCACQVVTLIELVRRQTKSKILRHKMGERSSRRRSGKHLS
jgi:hypothetical protein